MSFRVLRIKLLLVHFCWPASACWMTLYGQPACFITGGSEVICFGNSTTWSAPEGMSTYYWTGPAGFTAITRDITLSTAGVYIVSISDQSGTNNCSRTLTVNAELTPGSINTTLRQFCAGGTTAIGGTNPPYGPATGGSGSYSYTWQMQEGCTGAWNDISGTNTTSYTPVAPAVTTCYRRKVTDILCNTDSYTDLKRFEIFDDPVSQTILPQPSIPAVCENSPVSATFIGGSGGFPGGTEDIYEYSVDGGINWSEYSPGQNISTAGLTGNNVVRVRTRRISTGVNGCNYGSFISVSWTVKPSPNTSSIYHR
jgi:hypothetical protein